MDIRRLLASQEYEVEEVHAGENDALLQLKLRSVAATAACPCCQSRAGRVHSHYQRRVRDVSWGGHSVAITLRVRRFFCDQTDCPRRIFTERLPGLVAPHAQRTERLVTLMQQLGLLCGGSMSVTILRQLATLTSRVKLQTKRGHRQVSWKRITSETGHADVTSQSWHDRTFVVSNT